MNVKGIYINLSTNDVAKTKDFFTGIGLEFNSDFSDNTAVSFKASDNIFLMLMNKEKFIEFTKAGQTDSMKDKEVIISFELNSVEEVEEIGKKVLRNGGTLEEPVDHGFMYYRVFKDLDGHQFEIFTFK